MSKPTCKELNKIQSDLIAKALNLYKQGKGSQFWATIESLDLFLSVKEGLGCVRRKRKK